jgi:hypothetical protein
MRQCVCATEDKGAAAGLESSEALGLAGAGPGGGECSPQVVRLGPSRQARVLAGWHSLLLPLEPSLALLADVRLLQGPSRGSRSNWDPGGRRRRRLDCNNGPAATDPPLDLPYPTHSHMLQYATISRQHTYCDICEPEIDDSFLRKDDETGGATTL